MPRTPASAESKDSTPDSRPTVSVGASSGNLDRDQSQRPITTRGPPTPDDLDNVSVKAQASSSTSHGSNSSTTWPSQESPNYSTDRTAGDRNSFPSGASSSGGGDQHDSDTTGGSGRQEHEIHGIGSHLSQEVDRSDEKYSPENLDDDLNAEDK